MGTQEQEVKDHQFDLECEEKGLNKDLKIMQCNHCSISLNTKPDVKVLLLYNDQDWKSDVKGKCGTQIDINLKKLLIELKIRKLIYDYLEKNKFYHCLTNDMVKTFLEGKIIVINGRLFKITELLRIGGAYVSTNGSLTSQDKVESNGDDLLIRTILETYRRTFQMEMANTKNQYFLDANQSLIMPIERKNINLNHHLLQKKWKKLFSNKNGTETNQYMNAMMGCVFEMDDSIFHSNCKCSLLKFVENQLKPILSLKKNERKMSIPRNYYIPIQDLSNSWVLVKFIIEKDGGRIEIFDPNETNLFSPFQSKSVIDKTKTFLTGIFLHFFIIESIIDKHKTDETWATSEIMLNEKNLGSLKVINSMGNIEIQTSLSSAKKQHSMHSIDAICGQILMILDLQNGLSDSEDVIKHELNTVFLNDFITFKPRNSLISYE